MQNLSIYQNLSQINIITFWEIAESGNYTMMDKDFSEDKQYSSEQIAECNAAYLKLYDDYFLTKNDAMQKSSLQEESKEVKEMFKINMLVLFLESLVKVEQSKMLLSPEEYVSLVNHIYEGVNELEPKARLKPLDSFKVNSEKIRRIIQSLNNMIELKGKRHKQEVKKEARNFYENIASIESVLNRSIGDVNNINAKYWLALEKQAENVIKANKIKK